MKRTEVDFKAGVVTHKGDNGDNVADRSINSKLTEADWSVLFPEFRRIIGELRDLENVSLLRAKLGMVSNSYRELTDLIELRRSYLSEDDYCKEYVKLKSSKIELDEIGCRLISLEQDKNETRIEKESLDRSLLNKSNELNSSSRVKVKRPDLVLPVFDGEIVNFGSFMEQFDSAIHTDNTISDVLKLQYLISCCTGSAKTMISSMEVTAASYGCAREVLKQQYGNIRLQKIALRNKIRNLVPVYKVFPISKVKDCFAVLTSFTNSLIRLDPTFSSNSSAEMEEIISKFPSEITIDFHRNLLPENQMVKSALDFIAKNITYYEMLEGARNPNFGLGKEEKVEVKGEGKKKGSKNGKDKSQVYSMSNCLQSESDKSAFKGNRKLKCHLCDEEHRVKDCVHFDTVEKRQKAAANRSLCFNCLFPGHSYTKCGSKYRCSKCKGKHHTLLCDGRKLAGANANADVPEENKSNEACANVNVSCFQSQAIQLGIFTAFVKDSRGNSVKIRGALDSCSHRTMISSSLVRKLGIKSVGQVSICSKNFSIPKGEYKNYRVYNLEIQSRTRGNIFSFEAIETEEIPTVHGISDKGLIDRLGKIGVQLAEELPSYTSEIDIVIGEDQFWVTRRPGMERISEKCGLLNTIFGWTFSGVSPISGAGNHANVSMFQSEDSSLDVSLKNTWDLEAIGITQKDEKEEDFVRNLFRESVSKDDSGRFIVKIPYNDRIHKLESNWTNAIVQLSSTLRRLEGKPDLQARYEEAIGAYFKNDHSELVDRKDEVQGFLYYIPHHPVIKEERTTTKFRVVFNASSKSRSGFSLNDCVHPGPNLNPDVLSAILIFRLYKIILIGDIEKAFLQVLIHLLFRDVLRFLWIKPIFWTQPFSWKWLYECLIIYRMKVVPFGLNVSPFLLCASIREQAEQMKEQFPVEAETIDKSIYMDDLTGGADGETEAIIRAENLHNILIQARFPLVKWASNSGKVMESLVQKGFQLRFKDVKAPEDLKVLGVQWKVKDDTIFFKPLKKKEGFWTKRSIVSHFSEIFDPLGILAPATLEMRLLAQSLWKEKIGWDEEVSSAVISQVENWTLKMEGLEKFQLPRWLQMCTTDSICLEIFCDASPRAFGCVAYVSNGSGSRTFVMSKSRLAPLKSITLPRLELTAALVGARLASYIKNILPKEFKFNEIKFYSDSQITLAWIRSVKNKWKAYVTNRVEEILKYSSIEQWSYVPTASNPADFVTKPRNLVDLVSEKLWWEGPEEWSSVPVVDDEELAMLPSVSEELKPVENVSCLQVDTDEFKWIERFSSFTKLVRVVTRMLRWRKYKRGGIMSTDLSVLYPVHTNGSRLADLDPAKRFQVNQEI